MSRKQHPPISSPPGLLPLAACWVPPSSAALLSSLPSTRRRPAAPSQQQHAPQSWRRRQAAPPLQRATSSRCWGPAGAAGPAATRMRRRWRSGRQRMRQQRRRAHCWPRASWKQRLSLLGQSHHVMRPYSWSASSLQFPATSSDASVLYLVHFSADCNPSRTIYPAFRPSNPRQGRHVRSFLLPFTATTRLSAYALFSCACRHAACFTIS